MSERATDFDVIRNEELVQDEYIDPLIDATPVFSHTEPQLANPQALWAFANDIARKMEDWPRIAARWGFADENDMAEFIRSRPGLRQEIKTLRAVWFSSESTPVRTRKLAGEGVMGAIPGAIDIALNRDVPPTQRLDALRTCARIAGIDGSGIRGDVVEDAGEGPGRFSVQIIFQGAKKTETIVLAEPPLTIEGSTG